MTCFAIQQAREVVDFAYHAAGANAIFEQNPFERRFRDLHTVTQQSQAHLENFEALGQWVLGISRRGSLMRRHRVRHAMAARKLDHRARARNAFALSLRMTHGNRHDPRSVRHRRLPARREEAARGHRQELLLRRGRGRHHLGRAAAVRRARTGGNPAGRALLSTTPSSVRSRKATTPWCRSARSTSASTAAVRWSTFRWSGRARPCSTSRRSSATASA